jgi:hypothetical protein
MRSLRPSMKTIAENIVRAEFLCDDAALETAAIFAFRVTG